MKNARTPCTQMSIHLIILTSSPDPSTPSTDSSTVPSPSRNPSSHPSHNHGNSPQNHLPDTTLYDIRISAHPTSHHKDSEKKKHTLTFNPTPRLPRITIQHPLRHQRQPRQNRPMPLHNMLQRMSLRLLEIITPIQRIKPRI